MCWRLHPPERLKAGSLLKELREKDGDSPGFQTSKATLHICFISSSEASAATGFLSWKNQHSGHFFLLETRKHVNLGVA
jgi:hypothetical protein